MNSLSCEWLLFSSLFIQGFAWHNFIFYFIINYFYYAFTKNRLESCITKFMYEIGSNKYATHVNYKFRIIFTYFLYIFFLKWFLKWMFYRSVDVCMYAIIFGITGIFWHLTRFYYLFIMILWNKIKKSVLSLGT